MASTESCALDIHSGLKAGASRLSRRVPAWRREGSSFAAPSRDCSRSYLRSTGGHRQPGGLCDVYCCVHVPVVNCPAARACPLANVQRLGAILVPADRAHLAGGLEPADAAEVPSVHPGLVLQHMHECRPARIMHGFGQPGAGEPFDRQVFHGDRLVLADQRRGELVMELTPRIGHSRVRPGYLDPGPVPVPAAYLLAGQSLLCPPEFLLRPALRVNRMDCRRSLRDRNRGGPVFAPSRLRSRRRRSSGTPCSGPPGPAVVRRPRLQRAMPAPGWLWLWSAGSTARRQRCTAARPRAPPAGRAARH